MLSHVWAGASAKRLFWKLPICWAEGRRSITYSSVSRSAVAAGGRLDPLQIRAGGYRGIELRHAEEVLAGADASGPEDAVLGPSSSWLIPASACSLGWA